MDDRDIASTLLNDKSSPTNTDCKICNVGYRKYINNYIKWELVLLLVNILVSLIVIFKYVKDKQLDHIPKTLFRTKKSIGHFTQGITFVVLLVPFKFTQQITKFLVDKLENKNIYKNNKIEKNNDETDRKEIDIEKPKGEITKVYSHKFEFMIKINNTQVENRVGDNLGNQNDENILSENKVEFIKTKKNLYDIINSTDNTKEKCSESELLLKSLIFSYNTPKYKKNEIYFFFLCGKLLLIKKYNMIFILKYISCFLLMISYPLYNLIKRKINYHFFYYSSYYINAFDFACGVLSGTLFVLIYGIINYLIDVMYTNRKNDKYCFWDNYYFLNDITCICDENIQNNIKHDLYLKKIAETYFNVYYNYKSLLFMGILILSAVTTFSFFFTLSSILAYQQVHN
ncbi:conserved Plasmodium protein, unknown function [Plasmodium berghei]|uniref:Uncharacterized protein n=2 Tax=Plasmodium berghei TaxID=5821 RepID=A0A509AE04_PLABA|nr:conserved Plasmodium protein, unknown function [Plasmodium berghei ANKA]CXI08599.1 conserved Plasmodium protein, unknown function [Plasmodium berghei]SCL92750.1 conserved Plasmodium protein, unknown function [Plasmodium berghei]SCM15708.1 conserved Plasmodium protein, unknown function [Plasmodium berghei]SCM17502.1 conserved Plasmodium protein, unknown function [Plasmodium berghei]SCN22896.1 conserved Plasmodium protein, unknown function [Plasmodium berghei]|eukprot:XP_034420313.1 conserved Plasmodium protein, unknown function [Plasmodium berghei ANKA]